MTKLFVFDYEEPQVGFVELVDKMEHDTALKVVNSARVSYGGTSEKFTEKDKKLTKYLWSHEHTSPFRHTFYTFCVNVPLFTARQWIKYQVGSTWRSYEVDGNEIEISMFDHQYDTDKGCNWNELSARYSTMDPKFWYPEFIRSNPSHGSKQASIANKDLDHKAAIQQMKYDCEKEFKNYTQRIEDGWAKELARTCLPQNIYTTAYWTVSLQAVMHFLHQRLHKDAQKEIQAYANAIYNLIEPDISRIGLTKENLTGENE